MDIVLSVLNDRSDPISKLSALPDDLQRNDDFIVARLTDDASSVLKEQYITQADVILLEYGIKKGDALYQEALNAVINVIHESWKISYADLSAQFLRDVRAGLNLGSMAYRDTWEYSKLTHKHSYSTVRCYPKYTFEQISAQYDDPSQITDRHSIPEWVGTVRIWQLSSVQVGVTSSGRAIMSSEYLPTEIDIYTPHINQPSYASPEIGEARFMGWKTWPTAATSNPKLQTVNGQQMFYDSALGGYWVKPAGQTITCTASEFVDACKVYGCNGKTGADTSFTIPSISGFVRLNPGINKTNPMRYMPFQNGLSAHTHEVDPASLNVEGNRLNATIFVETSNAPCATLEESGNRIHSGSGAPGKKYHLSCSNFIAVEGSTHITQGDFYTNESDASLNKETFPAHNRIPFIVYIGVK